MSDAGSSHGGSANGSVRSLGSRAEFQSGAGKSNNAESSSFWLGVYGVLYTVSKERETSWIFFAIKYTLDLLQLFLLMANASYGWQFDTSSKMWKFMQILQVQPFMTQLGYNVFIILLYIFTALLLINVAICVWTFHSFQNNQFDFVWPIKFLRIFGYIFYQVLDIMSLSLFLTATDCQYFGGPASLQYYNVEFPKVYCWSFPHIIHFSVGVVSLIIFLCLAGAFIAAEMQLNPLTVNQDASAHSLVELSAFGIKAVMTLSQDFLTLKLLAIVWLCGSALLAYLYWKWEPMVVEWVNYLRVGTYFSILWCACVFMALQFPPDSVLLLHKTHPSALKDYAKTLEYALIGMLPAFGVGALASFLRLRYFRVIVLNRFRTAPLKAKTRSMYYFTDAREVEILSRCCRKWIDPENLDPMAVALAERVIKAGLEQLPNEPFMVIWYSSFLIDVQGSYRSGFAQLQVAEKMDVSYLDSFAIFSREQENTQRASGGGRAGTATDLVTFVEFQKNFRLALNAHREALLSLRHFWNLLLHVEVHFEDLTSAVCRIDRCVSAADRVYSAVLQRHSNSARILRMYAKFLERVKHDPWNASHWTAEAEKLEQQEEDARHNNLLGMEDDGGVADVGPGQRVTLFSVGPDGEERAVVVFNSKGLVQMANPSMREMFGFTNAEMKGKNITLIMPPALSEQHQQTLKAFVLKGHGSIVTRTTECVVIHKDRHMFAVNLTVVRISGVGEDSTFLAALEPVPQNAEVATVWVLPSGRVLSVDHTFTSWFGYSAADLEGSAASALMASQTKQLDVLLKQAKFAIIRLGRATHAASAAVAADNEEGAFTVVIGERVADDRLTASRSMKTPGGTARVEDLVADALDQAMALVVLPGSAAAVQSEWTLKDVHVKHKFADAADVEITISNRGGTTASSFCMHVLTLRRTGVAAVQPPQHMLVTSTSGAVLHVTEGLATALGSTPKVLMANGSSNAMDAMMVAPFALLHRSGPGRGGQPMPPGPPPPYSCRSGLAMLMPVARGAALPFSMSMKRRQGLDEMYNVCTMQQRTWEQALDERSLSLVVDSAGVVRKVGASPTSLFGFAPALLLGRSAACCIDILHSTDGGDTRLLLAELAARLEDTPGMSWRVGVGCTKEGQQQQVVGGAPLFSSRSARPGQLRAAIMTVAVFTPEEPFAMVPPAPAAPLHTVVSGPATLTLFDDLDGAGVGAVAAGNQSSPFAAASVSSAAIAAAAGAGVCLELRLWRADLVTDVVEVDSRGLVVETDVHLQKLYPPGLALGASSVQMLGHHIRNFVPLGPGRRYLDLFEENLFPPVPPPGDRSVQTHNAGPALRSNFRRQPGAPSAAGPPVLLSGRHRGDGQDLELTVQIVRKGSTGVFLVVRPYNAQMGDPNLHDYLTHKPRRFSACSAASGLGHHLGSQELTKDMLMQAGLESQGSDAVAVTMNLRRHGTQTPELAMPSVLSFARRSNATVTDDAAGVRGVHFNSGGAAAELLAGSVGMTGSMQQWVPESAPDCVAFSASGRQPAELMLGDDDGSDSDGGADNGSTHAGSLRAFSMHACASEYEHLHGGPEGEDGEDSIQEATAPVVVPAAAGTVTAAGPLATGKGKAGQRHSDDHHAAGSGSDASGADDVGGDDGEDADYRRGQRLKVLVRMLESDQVQRHVTRFRWHTLAVLALLALVGVAIYVITTKQVNGQITNVNNLTYIGQASRKMMRCAVYTLDLCSFFHKWPFTNLQSTLPGMSNTVKDVATALKGYATNLAVFETYHHGAYEGYGTHRQMPVKYGLRALWETPSVIERDYFRVASNQTGLSTTTFNSANNTWTTKTVLNTVSLYDHGNSMIAAMHDVLANSATHNASVAGTDVWGAWPSVAFIANNSETVLKTAYMTTLDAYSKVVIDATNIMNKVQLIILILQGVCISGLCVAYLWWLTNKVDSMRYSVYSVFTVVPQGLIRTLASQRFNLAEDGESDAEEEDLSAVFGLKTALTTAHGGTGGGGGTSGGKKAGSGGGPEGGGSGRGDRSALTKSGSGRVEARGPVGGTGGVWSRLKLWWRRKGQHTRRLRLKRSLRGVLWLCWPMVAWGSVVLALNAKAYTHLMTVGATLLTLNSVGFVCLYFWSVVYRISLMTYDGGDGPPNAIRLAQIKKGIKSRLVLMKAEYTRLLQGAAAGTPAQLTSQGLGNTPGFGASLLYNFTHCPATTATGCLPISDPFQQWSMHGMDMLFQHFFDVALQITLTTGMDPSSAGPEIGFIWRARDSIQGTMTLLVNSYKLQALGVYSWTHKLQMWAFIATLATVVLYFLFMRRPYLKKVKAETRRITELLTQLPMEVDVENLVRRALLSDGTAIPESGKTKDTAGAGGGGDVGAAAPFVPGGGKDKSLGGLPWGLALANESGSGKVPLLSFGSTKNKVIPDSACGGALANPSVHNSSRSYAEMAEGVSHVGRSGSSSAEDFDAKVSAMGKCQPGTKLMSRHMSNDSARPRYGAGIELTQPSRPSMSDLRVGSSSGSGGGGGSGGGIGSGSSTTRLQPALSSVPLLLLLEDPPASPQHHSPRAQSPLLGSSSRRMSVALAADLGSLSRRLSFAPGAEGSSSGRRSSIGPIPDVV